MSEQFDLTKFASIADEQMSHIDMNDQLRKKIIHACMDNNQTIGNKKRLQPRRLAAFASIAAALLIGITGWQILINSRSSANTQMEKYEMRTYDAAEDMITGSHERPDADGVLDKERSSKYNLYSSSPEGYAENGALENVFYLFESIDAAKKAGYKIATPGYIPEGFSFSSVNIASSNDYILTYENNLENAVLRVEQIPSSLSGLTEELDGNPISLQESTDSLTICWNNEQGACILTLTMECEDIRNQAEQIALSLMY